MTQVGARRPPRGVAPSTSPSSLWRLELSGDTELFAPGSRRQARLLLPALPQDMEVRFTPGPLLIDLRLGPRSDRGVALLSGPNVDAVAPLWRAIRGAGGIDLPGLDDRSYGPFGLAVLADQERPAAPAAGSGSPAPAGPLRYRYRFETERLVDASAWGEGAELIFEVTAADRDDCDAEARTVYAVGLRPGLRGAP